MPHYYLACDLGAESGRLILGTLSEARLDLQELHRFSNTPVKTGDSLTWDVPRLFRGLLEGLKIASDLRLPISSISCDSWGLDYFLLDSRGELIEPAFHYRDPRAARGVKRVLSSLSWDSIFAETGIQFMEFNTLYQLASEPAHRLAQANALVNVGDGFNYFLCGTLRSEQSLASTTQLYNPLAGNWSEFIIETLGFPRRLFAPIVPAGAILGDLRPKWAAECGLRAFPVIATCSHDTGAAVAAVPASGHSWAYLSSGTWSLMGVELSQPLLSHHCRELNFTNEIGYGPSVRVLKNLAGLWILQECRRHWAEAGTPYTYPELTALAAKASPDSPLINPADPRFLAPGQMVEKIAEFCRETNQAPPKGPGEVVRAVLHSLALLYQKTLEDLEALTRKKIECLQIVGGGSKNRLLNQWTADALRIPVIAGPAEATAAGNILVQAIAGGQLPSLEAARNLMRVSTDLEFFEPQSQGAWAEAKAKFAALTRQGSRQP